MTAATQPLRVMLVEDHRLVRGAIARTLSAPDVEVVGEASSAEEALSMVIGLRPDLMLIDIDLPGMSGIHLVRELSPRLPDTYMVMLTGSIEQQKVLDAMRAGADGYLTKDMPADALLRAVRGVRQGDLPMPRRLAAQLVRNLVEAPRGGDGQSGLSERELEVLKLVAEGLTDREIGDALQISPRTASRHVGNILDKLGARNRADAARRYREGF